MLIYKRKKCNWVDLFVRKSNSAAIEMYKLRGYNVHKINKDYYYDFTTEKYEDGYDMRKVITWFFIWVY